MSRPYSPMFAAHTTPPQEYHAARASSPTRLASHIQNLPLDISRSLLEWGAMLDRASARRWLLVSHRVKQWCVHLPLRHPRTRRRLPFVFVGSLCCPCPFRLEPLLYHTVVLRSGLQKRTFMNSTSEWPRWTKALIWSESVISHDLLSPVQPPNDIKAFESRQDLVKSTLHLFASFQSLRSLVWYGAVEEMLNVLGVLGKTGKHGPSLRRLHVLLQPSPFADLAAAQAAFAGLTHFSIGCCTFSSVEMDFCLEVLKQTSALTHVAVVPMLAIGLDLLCVFAKDVLEGGRMTATENEVACGAMLRVFAIVLPPHVDKVPTVQTRDPRFAMLRSPCPRARAGSQRLGQEDRILGLDYDWRYPHPEERDVWEVAEDMVKAETWGV